MKKNQRLLTTKFKIFKIPVLCLMVCLLLVSNLMANDNSIVEILNQRITLSAKDIPLKNLLDQIEQKTKVQFTYSPQKIEADKPVVIQVNNKKLKLVLDLLLSPLSIEYEVFNDRTIVLSHSRISSSAKYKNVGEKEKFSDRQLYDVNQLLASKDNTMVSSDVAPITVTGSITNANGVPLIGATVFEKGTSNGTVTDIDGSYSLSVDDQATLVISFLGFAETEIAVGGRSSVDVVMSESASALDEVIVTGYGRQAKRDITGSVATLSSKQINDIPVTSFENAIQGQLAGVQVSETSGEPGAGPSIRVRGVGSISAGNEPLYVIDGFPISKNVDLGVQGDNFRRGDGRFRPPTQNPLATLSPNDIESIQVLKDASSASIYGSRGSNGVILITTKKGRRSGAPLISYDAYVGSQSVANKLDLMNAEELIAYNKDATNNAYLQANPGASPSDPNSMRSNAAWRIADDISNPDGTDTDWQDVIFQSALVQSHNLSISGGADNVGYYVAANYYNQDGIIEGSGFDRYSVRMNLELDVTKKLRVGLNIAPSYTTSDKLPAGSPYFARPPGIVYSAIIHSPTVKPLNADGTPNQLDNQSYLLTSDGEGSSMTSASNPLAIIQGVDDKLTQFRTLTNIYGEYDIMEGLTFKTYLGVDINNYKRNFFRKNSLLYRTATSGEPYGQSSSSESFSWLAEQTLSYTKTIGTGHNIAAVVGYTAQKETIDVNTVVADNFPDDLVNTVSGGQVVQGTAVQEEWSLASMLARVNYDFDDRFLFTASIRADRSSRFGAGNKTGVFPSLSAGWRISRGMEDLDWLSDLKLRVSWGKTGNFLIPNYASIGLLNQANYTFGGVVNNGIAPFTISNRDLSWEKTSSYDIGLDFGFLNDRIYGAVEYFNSTTTDLLLAVQVPAALGFTNALTNIGEVVNKGFEFSITSRNTVGKFKWTTDLNFSTINNEVTKLGPSGDPILSSGGAGNRHITRIGDAIGSFYGYMTDGIYQNQSEIDQGPVDQISTPQPGDFRWKDINNDGVINASDRTVVGNYLPDFTYGITNTFTYNDVSFSFLLQGVQGAEVLNLTRRHMGNGEANYNSYRDWVNRWVSESQPGNGEIPRANRQTGNSNNRPSNFQVEDASYFRLRNVNLSYTFPKSTIGNSLASLRVYLSGTNLFTVTDYLGYNPEVNNIGENVNVQGEDYGAYPLSRIFTFGVNASF